jgi:hypothetical protein
VTNHDDSTLYRHPTTARELAETVNWDLKDPANRPLLEEAAQHLLKQEVLEGETLDAYLAKAQMPSGIDEWLKTGEVDTALAQASN